LGTRSHVLDGIEIPPRDGAIFGVGCPAHRKTWEVSAAVYAANGSSVLNNGTTCDAAFCQTSLTTCFFDAFTQLLSFSDLVKTHGGPNKSGPLHLAVQTIRVPNKFA